LDGPIEQWILRQGPKAVNYARTLIGDRDAAQDIVQESFCSLLRHRERYDLRRDGDKLLFTAVTNRCRNWVRRRRRQVSLESGPDSLEALGLADRRLEDPLARAAANELSAEIDAILASLPEKQRAAMHLGASGWEAREIGEILGVSANHAAVLLHRARKAIAAAPEPHLIEARE